MLSGPSVEPTRRTALLKWQVGLDACLFGWALSERGGDPGPVADGIV